MLRSCTVHSFKTVRCHLARARVLNARSAITAAANRFDKNKKPASQIQRSSVGTQVPRKRRQKKVKLFRTAADQFALDALEKPRRYQTRLQHFTQDPLL